MKFEIDRLAMLAAAKSAAKIAPSDSPIEALNGILVESNDDTSEVFLTATNHEVSIQYKIRASVIETGVMLIDARLLADMLSLLAGEFVSFSADKPQLMTVMGGKCRYDINCLPAGHYPRPTIPFPEETVSITGICSLAKRTVFAVSKDDHKPALQCVNVKLKRNAVHAEACDGMRMMLTKDVAGSPEERELLLPGKSLKLLADVSEDSDVYEVGEIGSDIVFVRGDMMFVMRKLVAGEYINTASALKGVKPAYSAVVDTHLMREALDLISVGFSEDNAVPVNLALSDDGVVLKRYGDYSQADSLAPAIVSVNTPDSGFYYNVTNLMKLFGVIGGRVKLEIDAKGTLLVKTQSEVYLQLPQRAPEKRVKNEGETKGSGAGKPKNVKKSKAKVKTEAA